MSIRAKKRWFQFGLQTLLLAMFVICVACAWLAYERDKVRRRQIAIAATVESGGTVNFDQNQPFRPPYLQKVLGDTTLGDVRAVRLTGLPVTDADLKHLADMTAMEVLMLDETNITDAGLAYLVRMKRLKLLVLSRTHITDAGTIYLSQLTALEGMTLDHTQVSDAGLIHLAALTKLETLGLDHTNVTSDGRNRLREALPNVLIVE